MSLEDEKKVNQKVGVNELLKKEHQDEMSKILAFGEKYKEDGERMKKEFWNELGNRYKFGNLLMQYRDNKGKYMEYLTEGEREKIKGLTEGGKEKFVEAYLHDKILYSGDKNKELEKKKYGYNDWKAGEVVMEEGESLDLGSNNIGPEGIESISKMELKEGVVLNLSFCYIGPEWSEVLSKMKLKEGVKLCLVGNNIGPEGAEAISRMKLKEGVSLDLRYNHIGDAGAEAILNMELKEGVCLDLIANNISKDMRKKLKDWVQGYKNMGINCDIIV